MKRLLLLLPALILSLLSQAQIVNRLNVDADTFERYAWGRMQAYNTENLALADSLYTEGVRTGNFRYKCLGLSLEFPVRFVLGEYDRMSEAVAEIKELTVDKKDLRSFYYHTLHEYCQYLVLCGRVSDAMLEARDMQRIASSEKNPLGKMYSCRILGLIQSYRDNHYLAVSYFEKAIGYCSEARSEQDLPNLYILIAQEYVKMQDFPAAEKYCALAEEYQEYSYAVKLKCRMTRAYLYYNNGNTEEFWNFYGLLKSDRRYPHQTDVDARRMLDICYLRSRGLLSEALGSADSLGTSLARYEQKHSIYADMGEFGDAYTQISGLMSEKDSLYIKVQNEDLAILDAEMNNAQLREDAQRLKAQNQITILVGFLVMFAIAFFSIIVQQWRLRENLDLLKRRNAEMLRARRAYQNALDSKEAENSMRIKILQNRKSSTIKL